MLDVRDLLNYSVPVMMRMVWRWRHVEQTVSNLLRTVPIRRSLEHSVDTMPKTKYIMDALCGLRQLGLRQFKH